MSAQQPENDKPARKPRGQGAPKLTLMKSYAAVSDDDLQSIAGKIRRITRSADARRGTPPVGESGGEPAAIPIDQSIGHSVDQSVDQSIGQSTNQSTIWPIERSIEKPHTWPIERSNDRPIEASNEIDPRLRLPERSCSTTTRRFSTNASTGSRGRPAACSASPR